MGWTATGIPNRFVAPYPIPPSGARIELVSGDAIPPELVAKYPTIVAAILIYQDNNVYHYLATQATSVGYIQGNADNQAGPDVRESVREEAIIAPPPGTSLLRFGELDDTQINFSNLVNIFNRGDNFFDTGNITFSDDSVFAGNNSFWEFTELVSMLGGLALQGDFSIGGTTALPRQADNFNFRTVTGVITYNATATPFGRSFVAPASGSVHVFLTGSLGTNSTTAFTRVTYLSADIREGNVVNAGTVVLAAADSRAAEYTNITTAAGNKFGPAAVDFIVDGLTPGDDYNVTQMLRINVAGDTGGVRASRITVVPLYAS